MEEETSEGKRLPKDVLGIEDFRSKKGNSTSRVWKYYGFPRYSCGADKGKVICKLCNQIQPYKNQTTNMHTHLTRKHWKEVHVSI